MSEQTTILADGTETVALEITSVRYDRLINLGNYENEKIGVSVQIPEGADPAEVVKQCRAWCWAQLTGDSEVKAKKREIEQQIYALSDRRRRIESDLSRLEEAHQLAVPVLAAVGITPETRPDLAWVFPKSLTVVEAAPIERDAAVELSAEDDDEDDEGDYDEDPNDHVRD